MLTNKNLAAIDIGTNSIHLIVVKIQEHGNFEIIDREKEVIRLGEGFSGDIKKISEDAILRAIAVLKRFKEIADSHNAIIRAIATSAVRESSNKVEFIKRVHHEIGIDIEVVSGQEEARLIYLGILRAVPVFDERVLTIDIGGGSTEFVIGIKGRIEFSRSLKLGAVRLTHKFFPNYKVTKAGIQACKEWVEGEIYTVTNYVEKYGFNKCVGSSGTIQATGFLVAANLRKDGAPSSILNNFEFTFDELTQIKDEILNNKTESDRKKIKGMDSKRADIFPAGIIILHTIFEKLKIKQLTISDYALREGIVIDSLQSFSDGEHRPRLSDIRYESVLQLAKSCYYDREHCYHVAELALKIFDNLNDIHGLSNREREYLEAASLLHDIGHHISHNKHHKHSDYIIRNSDLMGFTENEINIIANIARYHRKSHPKNKHEEFSSLPKDSQKIVRKLAAFLRIADSLDRTHFNKITGVSIETKNGEVQLNLHHTADDLDIEKWNFERRKKLFEEVFSKKIVLNT